MFLPTLRLVGRVARPVTLPLVGIVSTAHVNAKINVQHHVKVEKLVVEQGAVNQASVVCVVNANAQ